MEATKTLIRIEHPSDGLGLWQHYYQTLNSYMTMVRKFGSLVSRHFQFPSPINDLREDGK